MSAETPWSGLGRFVFSQRVSGFRAVGPGSVPAKCQIYPSRVRPRGVIEPIEMEIRPAGQPEGPPGCCQGVLGETKDLIAGDCGVRGFV